MSDRTKRRITYVTLAVFFAVALSSEAWDTTFFILGMLTMDMIHYMWKSRNFTISWTREDGFSSRCELCGERGEMVLSGVGLRTTIEYSLRHARQHHRHEV